MGWLRARRRQVLLLAITALLAAAAAAAVTAFHSQERLLPTSRPRTCLRAVESQTDAQAAPATSPSPWQTLVDMYSGTKTTHSDREYRLITGLPLKPFFERETRRYDAGQGMWTFEQEQAFFNVSTNIRMTAVQLPSGGLWVHAPVAPTLECQRLLREVGEVEHIVLPTTALEHKVYMRDFTRAYPKAQVWVCPGQWSWPINLPLRFRVDGMLVKKIHIPPRPIKLAPSLAQETPPWADDIDLALFSPPVMGLGPTNECVFFHKKSRTLLVTDTVIHIGVEPPDIIPVPALLASSVEEGEPLPPDTLAARRKGWAKMALQILFLGPATADTFQIVSQKIFVSPVIRIFVLQRAKASVRQFVDEVTKWPFTRIIPCHFKGPVAATPNDFRAAFSFAFDEEKPLKPPPQPRSGVQSFFGSLSLKQARQLPQDPLASIPAQDL
ncbi:hypothetical protein JKP88DRAFT_262068, partial [Tribonema minus]